MGADWSTDPPASNGIELRLSEVLSALSHALDITEGQPRGHSERSCLIGMRLAQAIGLDEETKSAAFYALLLKTQAARRTRPGWRRCSVPTTGLSNPRGG